MNYISAKEAAEFLGIARQTLYNNLALYPHLKRRGKLLFLKSDLIHYEKTRPLQA